MESPRPEDRPEVEGREKERPEARMERQRERGSAAAKKMYDDMTSSRKRSISDSAYLYGNKSKRKKEDLKLPTKANSIPLDRYNLKTYITFRDYQETEEAQITNLIRELNISVYDGEQSSIAEPGGGNDTRMRSLLRESARSHAMNEPQSEGSSHLGQTEAAESLKTIYKHSLLLLKAPKACRTRSEYARDEAMRTEEYKAFCKLYPGLVDHSVQKTETTVNTLEEIESSIRMFFSEGASHAVMAVIIFNGHGSKSGLSLSNDDPLPLNKFISKVTLLLDEHREEQECKLPHLVKIVFAQCHGHRYTEPHHRHDIWAISFTSDKQRVTLSDSDCEEFTPKEDKFTHRTLTEYSRRCSVAEEMLGMIRQTKPSDVTSVHTVELPILD